MRPEGIICLVFLAAYALIGGVTAGAVRPQDGEGPPSVIEGADGKEMVLVPGGYFTFGSADGMSDEAPVRKIFLDVFYLDKYEVTNREFQRFVEATGYHTTAEQRGWGWVWVGEAWEKVDEAYWRQPLGPGSDALQTSDHPVVHMSWGDATAYCTWAKKRLPSEAEWEKRARGSSGRIYPWGDELPEKEGVFRANYNQGKEARDGFLQTAPVGSFPQGRSPYGAMDMGGNVWEWVSDWYEAQYYEKAWYKNPQGPRWGMVKVLRGGSWFESETSLRASRREYAFQVDYLQSFGFRCAKSEQ